MAEEGVKLLDDMLIKLGNNYPDYVFVFNVNDYKELGDTYKGRTIRRFKLVEKNSGYLMPDPIFDEEQFLKQLKDESGR